MRMRKLTSEAHHHADAVMRGQLVADGRMKRMQCVKADRQLLAHGILLLAQRGRLGPSLLGCQQHIRHSVFHEGHLGFSVSKPR